MTTLTERDCATHGHCWHVSPCQHTIDCHRDDVCCWCHKARCVRVEVRPIIPDGEPHRSHGDFSLHTLIGWEKPGPREYTIPGLSLEFHPKPPRMFEGVMVPKDPA